MHLKKLASAFILLCFSIAPVFAQTTGGSVQWQAGGTLPVTGIAYIDFSHPISADGTIAAAAFRWLSDNPCAGAGRIRIFRPSSSLPNSFTLVGETPAFDITPGNTILFTTFPAIAVQKNDLVSIAQVSAGGSCGGATFSSSTVPGDFIYQISSNYTGGTLSGMQLRRNVRLDVVVSSAPLRFAGVIPVVGSVQGVGALFRSSLQITNPCPSPIEGMLVFHPAGVPGTASDPTVQFQIPASASKSYADVTAAFNRSGIGSIDVYTSSCIPEMTAYVYNDVGAAGTYGFTEDLVRPSEMPDENAQFFSMPIPTDLTNFRVNVGIRTLGASATIGASVSDADGNFKGSIPLRTYGPNYFEQIPLTTLMAIIPPPPGGRLFLFVQSGGPVILYSSTIDTGRTTAA